MGRRKVPLVVIEAARALGVPQEELSLLRGAAGQTWSSEDQVLRVRPAAALKVELAAWAAAASVVPTPEVIDLAELGTVSAALVQRLPGRPAGDLGMLTLERARKRGQACGRVLPVTTVQALLFSPTNNGGSMWAPSRVPS